MRLRIIHIGLVALLVFSADSFGADVECAPKVSLRLSNGIIRNDGTGGGSTNAIGGVNLLISYFLSPYFSLNGGYHWNFDYAAKSVPVSGFEFALRYYVMGQGTRTREKVPGGFHEKRDNTSFYVGAELSQANYYLGSNPPEFGEAVITGNSLGMNAAIGMDQKITDNLDLTLEGNMGVMSFATSDDRFRISAMLFKIGLSYLW